MDADTTDTLSDTEDFGRVLTAEAVHKPIARGKSGHPLLHTIEFVDGSSRDDTCPVHVTHRVLINGKDVSTHTVHRSTEQFLGLRIRNDHPLIVETNGGLAKSEALVSFVIHADDVRMPTYASHEPDDCPLIGDYEPLIPHGDDTTHRWTIVDRGDHGTYVRVWIMAHTILFRPLERDPRPLVPCGDGHCRMIGCETCNPLPGDTP